MRMKASVKPSSEEKSASEQIDAIIQTWNAPSFCDDGKDRLTIMLHKKDSVGLILHTGAKPKEDKKALRLYEDHTGILEWNSNIRATILFVDMTDFLSKRSLFKKAVKQWIDETKNL